jgi:hypothetical protein
MFKISPICSETDSSLLKRLGPVEFSDPDRCNCFTNVVLRFIQYVWIISIHTVFQAPPPPPKSKSQGYKCGHLAGYTICDLCLQHLVQNANGIISSVLQDHLAYNDMSSLLLQWSKKWGNNVTYCCELNCLKTLDPYYSCSSNGTPHTNLLIMIKVLPKFDLD